MGQWYNNSLNQSYFDLNMNTELELNHDYQVYNLQS